jgi:hypothetical protein
MGGTKPVTSSVFETRMAQCDGGVVDGLVASCRSVVHAVALPFQKCRLEAAGGGWLWLRLVLPWIFRLHHQPSEEE